MVTVSEAYSTTETANEQKEMVSMTGAHVKVPEELIDRARENSGMVGSTLTNLVRAGIAALAMLPSEQALELARQGMKDYGSVRGRPRKQESETTN